MRPATNADLQPRRTYQVNGAALPYSEAVQQVDHPRFCMIGDVHDPAEPGSNLCSNCSAQLGSDLRLIEDRWENLEDELMTVRQKSNGERPGSSTEGSAAPIDLNISEAMGLARDVVWAVIARMSQDQFMGRNGKLVVFRTNEGTWALAGLLARYHVDYIATHPDQDFTDRVYRMAWSAGRKVEDVVHPPTARQPIDSHCHQWITTDEGGRAPCPGQLEGVARWDGTKTVECSADPMHLMPIEKWMQIVGQRATHKRKVAGRLLARYGATS